MAAARLFCGVLFRDSNTPSRKKSVADYYAKNPLPSTVSCADLEDLRYSERLSLLP
jgi:hypothetical protein